MCFCACYVIFLIFCLGWVALFTSSSLPPPLPPNAQGEEPSVETLKKCLRAGTLGNVFVPVLTGTAFKNKGVQPLLDAVVDFMPSPIEVEAIKGVSVRYHCMVR